MLTLMLTQIDPLCRHPGTSHGRLDGELRFRDERHYHTVVRSVRLHVDHAGTVGPDRVGDFRDDIDAAAFREIGDALYECCQIEPPATVRRTRLTPA